MDMQLSHDLMQRTYGRRRRRSAVQSQSQSQDQDYTPSQTPKSATSRYPSVDISPPRKRPKVLVEHPTPFSEREPTPEAPTQSPPNNLPTRNLRTYAGRSRSFLVALPVPDTDPANTVEDDSELHESYTDLRTRWGIDNSEDDPRPDLEESQSQTPRQDQSASQGTQPSLPLGMMNDLKSITELRSKGESRRFLDEVGYLFEGLDSSSAIGLRRASALEVVRKLCDPGFNRRAKASDFYIRTWDKLWTSRAGSSDKIFDATIAFFAALAARDSRTLMEVAQQKDFVPVLVEILSSLDHKRDALALTLASDEDADLKSFGILRTEIIPIKSLAGVVSKEPHLSVEKKPSARFFVSNTLAALPPSFIGTQYLPALLTSLRAELGLLGPRLTAFESGLPLLPTISATRTEVPSLYHIEACLRLLDSYLLGHWSLVDAPNDHLSGSLPRIEGFASELLSLCVVCSRAMQESSSEEEITIARKCLCGALRVLTLLSHDNPWWCSATLEESHALPFTTMIVMQTQARWSESRTTASSSQISSVEAFDLLCLALGLVMNWATLSPKVTRLSKVTSINPACPGSRLCVRACQCPHRISILACLADLYTQYADNQQNELPESIFLRGYIAVLLGLLMKNDPANQTLILAELPGDSPSDSTQSLLTHCRSFLDLYTDTMTLPSSDSPRASPEPEPLLHVHTDPRPKTSWDKRGEDIARGVIASLELLLYND